MQSPRDTTGSPLEPHDATVILNHSLSPLARHLRADGFNVLEARNATDLIARCKAFRSSEAKNPDVLISDDLEAVEALQRDGDAPPFILLTRRDDWRTFIAAERAGAAYVFEASPDDSALRSAVFSLTRSW